MQMESLPVDIGPRRSKRLVKKPLVDRAVVIDLDDEEEELGRELVSSTRTRGIARREDERVGLMSRQEKSSGTKSEVDEKEGLGLVGTAGDPASSWRFFEKNIAQKVMEMSLEDIGHLDYKDDSIAFGADESAIWQEALDPASQEVDASSQQADLVDLSRSSSESGDDGDGDMDDIVEEQEDIITTLSSEDAVLLAEVMKVIKEGGDLKKLKVESLKAYLRHHRLRMVGVKAVLLSRIQEHLKIKDGQAEEMYPRSSFCIDCTGDVCLGDTVLFLQNVYDTPFDIQKRCASGPPLGQRWVAGKVVNESYGTEKQQHTFTIEVLWSTGTQPFYVMRPVKIKGRNLYRVRTLRQPWPNEAERQRALDEKHARGGKARALRRAMKSLKSRGRTKSRLDARVHPYLRSRTSEPPRMPPRMPPQNYVPYASIHTQDNVHQGSVPALAAPARTPSMQHEIHTKRAGFTERCRAPEPTVPRRRNFHGQQYHHEGFTETLSAPEPVEPRGRNIRIQQSRYEGNSQAHHVPLTIHVHHSVQHGRVHIQRQVHQGGLASQNTAHPNLGRQQGAGAVTIPCSTAGCEKLGAKQCISRSCASCCSRNGTTRGRCPRHH